SGSAWAQQQSTPVQIAGEYSALGLDRGLRETGSPGLGVRVEVALTRRVEIEGRMTWFPANLVQEFQTQGGKTLQAAAGIRGKLFVSRDLSVYGLLLPGLRESLASQRRHRLSGGSVARKPFRRTGRWPMGNRRPSDSHDDHQ